MLSKGVAQLLLHVPQCAVWQWIAAGLANKAIAAEECP